MRKQKLDNMKAKLVIFLILTSSSLLDCNAGSATWNLNPAGDDWNTATNWTPNTVPNGKTDTATFDLSNVTDVTVSDYTTVDGIVFNPGASAFTITVGPVYTLTFDGAGIVNNSGVQQTFVSPSTTPLKSIFFYNQATAGNNTFFDNLADGIGQGNVNFFNYSTAGTATFMNHGLNFSLGGSTFFWDHSSAGEGTFINTGAPAGTVGGNTVFFDHSTAANATIICNGGISPSIGGGYTEFFSDAGNATVIANGGTGTGTEGGFIDFFGGNPANATVIALGGIDGGEGGHIGFNLGVSVTSSARVELFGNAYMYFPQDRVRIEVGSIEGEGNIFLNKGDLVVGNNNLGTIFSGIISDTGTFTKVGGGTLTLRGSNTYSGDTTLNGGTLKVQNIAGSGTGTGSVSVLSGSLAGSGVISGAVTIGDGTDEAAFLAPGKGASVMTVLTLQNLLTFHSNGGYVWRLHTEKTRADLVIAAGVTIDPGATVKLKTLGRGQLKIGKVATLISNTAASPISGTFANLTDGETIKIDRNTYQANYEGGDGNDLTLTVVP